MISVIIPTFNRPLPLADCLSALARSRLPRDAFEVIVVDDGGITPVDGVVSAHAGKLDVRLERQENRGPATARNRGAELARGALLAFTDDDCLPDPDWLSALAAAAAEHPKHLIGGETVNRLRDNPYSSASQHLVSYLYSYSDEQRDSGRWRPFFASNNFAVPARSFRELGGFDVTFPLAAGEDREFCDRWLVRGLPMILDRRARVEHAHPLTLASFWRQHLNYGRGAFHFRRARGLRGETDFTPEPPAFYLGLLRFPFGRVSWKRALTQSTLLGLSQAATVVGYFGERRRARSPADPSTP